MHLTGAALDIGHVRVGKCDVLTNRWTGPRTAGQRPARSGTRIEIMTKAKWKFVSAGKEMRGQVSTFDSAAKPPVFGEMGRFAKENLNDFNTHFFKNPGNRGFATESTFNKKAHTYLSNVET